MRKRIVAGNWKMNKTLQEGIELAKEVNNRVKALAPQHTQVIVGTPFIHLAGFFSFSNFRQQLPKIVQQKPPEPIPAKFPQP